MLKSVAAVDDFILQDAVEFVCVSLGQIVARDPIRQGYSGEVT